MSIFSPLYQESMVVHDVIVYIRMPECNTTSDFAESFERFWRQYVATAEATEEVQELLIQHEVFKESLVSWCTFLIFFG